MPFGTTKEASGCGSEAPGCESEAPGCGSEAPGCESEASACVHARPSFFAACQKPLTTVLMPLGMVRRTYSTACRWSGIRQKCNTCTSV